MKNYSRISRIYKTFNAGKIVKLRCNYNLNKKVDGRVGNREKINTFFDLYLKKSEDQIRSYQLNDFIRGVFQYMMKKSWIVLH